MTPPAPTGGSKRDRREAAREKARLAREAEARRRRRNKWLLQGGLALGVVAIVAVVVLVVVQVTRPSGPGPRNMASDGIVLESDGAQGVTAVSTPAIPAGGTPTPSETSDDAAHIVVYQDYLCPFCGQFDRANAELLTDLVSSGRATLELHPISILDAQSQGTRYATRAAAAAACVADARPEAFLDVNTALYAQQPEEGTAGLSDDELVALVQDAGATGDAVETCVRDGGFTEWVGDATDRALEGPLPGTDVPAVQGTPTVLVDGQQYPGSPGDAAAFAQFLQEAAGLDTTATDGAATTEPDAASTPAG